jgi:thioredoxin 1
MVKHIGSVPELEKVFSEAGDKLVLIDFYATWCGPCKVIAPELEKLAGEYSNVVVLKVDVDEAEEVAQKYDISAMPTFKLFHKGKEISMVMGANLSKLKELFETKCP